MITFRLTREPQWYTCPVPHHQRAFARLQDRNALPDVEKIVYNGFVESALEAMLTSDNREEYTECDKILPGFLKDVKERLLKILEEQERERIEKEGVFEFLKSVVDASHLHLTSVQSTSAPLIISYNPGSTKSEDFMKVPANTPATGETEIKSAETQGVVTTYHHLHSHGHSHNHTHDHTHHHAHDHHHSHIHDHHHNHEHISLTPRSGVPWHQTSCDCVKHMVATSTANWEHAAELLGIGETPLVNVRLKILAALQMELKTYPDKYREYWDLMSSMLTFGLLKEDPEKEDINLDFNLGLLKWVANNLETCAKVGPEAHWRAPWNLLFVDGVGDLLSDRLRGEINQYVDGIETYQRPFPITVFYPFFFECVLEELGMDMLKWKQRRGIYLPHHHCVQYARAWVPQQEALMVCSRTYSVLRYNLFPLTTPMELWSEWACGLWGESSVRNHEYLRWELQNKPKEFAFRCPLRQALLTLIIFGVVRKDKLPQEIVDYLQCVMLINMKSDMLFMCLNIEELQRHLYPVEVAQGKYKLSVRELFECRYFNGTKRTSSKYEEYAKVEC